jgi:hypothetical protein
LYASTEAERIYWCEGLVEQIARIKQASGQFEIKNLCIHFHSIFFFFFLFPFVSFGMGCNILFLLPCFFPLYIKDIPTVDPFKMEKIAQLHESLSDHEQGDTDHNISDVDGLSDVEGEPNILNQSIDKELSEIESPRTGTLSELNESALLSAQNDALRAQV